MPEQKNFRLRVFFQKAGRLSLLSHLELARALERAVRRAGLPYAVSEGFSPHMRIAFGAALPVGVGGLAECFDLFLTHYVAPERAYEALMSSSVEDLMVSSCEYISAQAPAASAAYPYSTYEAILSHAPQGTLVFPETIKVKRKKGEKELRVKDYLVGDPLMAGDVLTFTLCAKTTGSLRPDVLVEVILEQDQSLSVLSLTRIKQNTFF